MPPTNKSAINPVPTAQQPSTPTTNATPTLITRITELVHACFTGLYVETREPEEAVRDLTRITRRESWRLGIWDCDGGLKFPCEELPVNTKRRREDVQPLPPAIVEPLRPWLVTCEPGKPVFDLIARNTARMPRSDLAAARKAWFAAAGKEPKAVQEQMQASDFLLSSDEAGCVADFHSLRVFYISEVVASGASIKEAQTLARHSTPLLTMNV